MAHKYGIYQSTSNSCTFYKQDDDGNQSTFNLFAASAGEKKEKKTIFAFIDNEEFRKDNWSKIWMSKTYLSRSEDGHLMLHWSLNSRPKKV